MVTARQKALVEASWDRVRPMALQVAELLCDRLFELDPLLEEMFESELTEHEPRLMQAIGSLVTGLADLETTLAIAREMGRRHADHGVRPAHYTTFGKAWLWTLEQSLDEDFTLSLEDAWTAVHALLSSAMIEGAEAADPNQAEPESSLRRRSTLPPAGLRTAH